MIDAQEITVSWGQGSVQKHSRFGDKIRSFASQPEGISKAPSTPRLQQNHKRIKAPRKNVAVDSERLYGLTCTAVPDWFLSCCIMSKCEGHHAGLM